MINLKTFTDLPKGRYGHVCGILRDRSGNPKKVVVAGGYGRDGLLPETEILDLELGVWSQGPPVEVFAAGKYSNELEVSNA
jgi:hypothetical protein